MRRKLASAPPVAEPKPAAIKTRKTGSWFWGFVILGLLAAANFMALSKKDYFLERLGFRQIVNPISPLRRLAFDDKALFWAYAAYDPDRLHSRFGVPATAAIDPDDARHHLEIFLKGDLSQETRDAIAAMKRGPETAPAAEGP